MRCLKISKLKKILVAYDGSPHSKEALQWALDLSLPSGAEVAAVKVCAENELFAMTEVGVASFLVVLDEIRQENQNLLDEVRKQLMDEVSAVALKSGVKVQCEALQGNITRQLLSYAKNNNFDLIVVGSKGHGVLEEMLMGSITRNLVSLAHIPVLVVKD